MALCELPFGYISSEESGGLGGTCVLRGCVPKKLMVYASSFAEEFKDSIGFGYKNKFYYYVKLKHKLDGAWKGSQGTHGRHY